MLYGSDENTNNSKPVQGGAPETGSQCGADGMGDGVNDDPPDDSTVDDGCPSTSYTYDAQNNVLSVLDGLGNVTSSAYDAKGNLKTVTDANRKAVGTAESGSQCGAAGTGNDTDDDGDGVKDDGCPSAIYNYDNGDRLIEVVDALGNSTTYGYDANGNRTSVTNAKRQAVGTNGPETGSQCGTAGTGNGVNEDEAPDDTVADDGCPSTIYAYDALNRLTSATDALGYVTSYQYDATSNLTQRTDARGLITRYFPDDLNRVDILQHCTADAPPGECSGEYLVDSVGYEYNAAGFRTQMVDSTGTTTYTPDDLDRIASVTFPGPKTVGYIYDDLPGGSAADYPGQRTKITYPDAKEVEYTYEADGRMKTVTDWLAKQTVYTYDDAGRLTKTELPNGAWTDYGYDAADRLTGVANKKTGPVTISTFGYELDAAGNRRQMTDLSGVHSYKYDALYRLTEVTYPGPATDTYTYDANGNRQARNTDDYTYDGADRMLTAGGVTYGYDPNGNQTGRGADTFEYDHENRLTKVNPSGSQNRDPCYDFDGNGQSHIEDTTAVSARFGAVEGDPNYDPYYDIRPAGGDGIIHMEDLSAVSAQFGANCLSRFVYNGDGLRVRRDGDWALISDYTWDVATGLPVILNEKDRHYQLDGETAGHGVNNTYVYGLDLISVTDKGGNQSYFQYDGLGSTTDLTDGGANVTASYGYDVFGALRSGSPGANSFLFTGEQRDALTNLYYLRARHYDPATGRFLTRDRAPSSVGRPAVNNPFAYVGNDPINLVDPSGLWCPKDPKDCVPKPVRQAVENEVVEPIVDTVSQGVNAFSTGYVDVGGTVCPVPWFISPCLTAGAQFGAGQGFHAYAGGGAGSFGGGVNATFYPDQTISKGLTCAFQGAVTYPPAFGVGANAEVGFSGISVDWKESTPTFSGSFYGGAGPYIGTPGLAGVCYYVF